MLVSICVMLFPSSLANTVDTYTEDFEDDIDGANPTEDWLTYYEEGFNWANVTDSTYHGGAQSFIVNDTNGAASANVCFNITAREYDTVEFWFKADTSLNNETRIFVYSGSEYVWLNLTDTKIYASNSTTLFVTQTLTNNTWYRAYFDFNYTDDTARLRLYNGTTLENDTWLKFNGDSAGFSGLIIEGPNTFGQYVFLDDISIVRRYYVTPTFGLPSNFTEMITGFLVAIFTISLIVIMMKAFGKMLK